VAEGAKTLALAIKEISPFAACFVTRGHLENRAGRKHAFQALFQFYGNGGTKFRKQLNGGR
jgi:hypothetical protein